jgi:hypothetical protein
MKRLAIAIFVLLMAVPTAAYAKDWFVRPAGGDYGLENGTSYDNAWDGLPSVVWGNGGVAPGDNLYICGLHVHDARDKYALYGKRTIPLISGEEGKPITIRGDYPNDPGIVWGAYRMGQSEWTNMGGGVWSIKLPFNSYTEWYFQDIGKGSNDSHIVLKRAASLAEVKSTPGTQYSAGKYAGGDLLYVHLTDSGNPEGRVYGNRWGYFFNIADNKYITFYNLKLMNPFRISSDFPKVAPSHITWQGCTLSYGEHSLLWFWDNFHYMKVIDCELSWAGNGIYNISQTGDSPSNYLFKGNYIHDIGIVGDNQNSDAHCIGIQGGHDGVIEDNICVNCGTGPLLYVGKVQEITNTIVRRNFVKDLHTLGSATGYGVSTMCNNNNASDKSGNQFIQNIVVNAKVGYRFQFDERQVFVNNIAYNCEVGMESIRTRSEDYVGASVYARNNIFINDTTDGSFRYHINWNTGAWYVVADFDKNIYYPIDGKYFYLKGKLMTYDEWRALVPSTYKYATINLDPNSVGLKDKPDFFVNETGKFSKPADFKLQKGSLPIDKGMDLDGLSTDFENNPVVGTLDIGPYEYQPVVASTTPEKETTETTEPPKTSQPEPAETSTDRPDDYWDRPLTTEEKKAIEAKRYEFLGMTAQEYWQLSYADRREVTLEWYYHVQAQRCEYFGLDCSRYSSLPSAVRREYQMKYAIDVLAK